MYISPNLYLFLSQILMAGNTLVAFYWREVMLQAISTEAWEYLAVCVPIVVIGAPCGSMLGSHFHRQVDPPPGSLLFPFFMLFNPVPPLCTTLIIIRVVLCTHVNPLHLCGHHAFLGYQSFRWSQKLGLLLPIIGNIGHYFFFIFNVWSSSFLGKLRFNRCPSFFLWPKIWKFPVFGNDDPHFQVYPRAYAYNKGYLCCSILMHHNRSYNASPICVTSTWHRMQQYASNDQLALSWVGVNLLQHK